MYIAGVQAVLPSNANAADYAIKIWKGWSLNKPENLIFYTS